MVFPFSPQQAQEKKIKEVAPVGASRGDIEHDHKKLFLIDGLMHRERQNLAAPPPPTVGSDWSYIAPTFVPRLLAS